MTRKIQFFVTVVKELFRNVAHGGNATAAASSAVLLACPDPSL